MKRQPWLHSRARYSTSLSRRIISPTAFRVSPLRVRGCPFAASRLGSRHLDCRTLGRVSRYAAFAQPLPRGHAFCPAIFPAQGRRSGTAYCRLRSRWRRRLRVHRQFVTECRFGLRTFGFSHHRRGAMYPGHPLHPDAKTEWSTAIRHDAQGNFVVRLCQMPTRGVSRDEAAEARVT